MKTSELIGAALDWAVGSTGEYGCGFFSTDWSQGGPIIERECIDFYHQRESSLSVIWCASYSPDDVESIGPTPLIAAMRCYVASVLGDEVEIPKELTA